MLVFLLLVLVPVFGNFDAEKPGSEKKYGFQVGQISMNDSEITILINSTFEIIEDYENETEIENSKMKSKSSMGPTTNNPIRFKKIRPSTCQKYTETEKYRLLEDAGGINQGFMATSVDEAATNFADTFPDSPTMEMSRDQVEIQKKECNFRCETIKKALNREIARRSSLNDTHHSTLFNDSPTTSTPCTLGNFIPVGECSELGEMTSRGGGYESLCSACRGLYMLSSNCFPRIFNAIQCNSSEMGCIFDQFTDKAHGQCEEQSLSFKVLRNIGDSDCEEWSVEQVELPIACQCALSKNSFLRATPRKEL